MKLPLPYWFFCISSVLAIIAAFFAFLPAQASSFLINDNGDLPDAHPGDGVCATSISKCTLRAAIDEANSLTGPDSITIPAMTILVRSELRIFDNVGDDSITINGAGQNQTVIDGNNSTRVFVFDPRSGNHTISNLTIRNASNSRTDGANKNGGGIFNEAGLVLTNVTITGSQAYQGGGVYNQYAFTGPAGENIPTLILRNVTLTNNRATANQTGYGGGGLFNGSVLDGDHVTIENNTAEVQGGGFYNNSYKTSILKNFVVANNSSRNGGGINNDMGNITLENGHIENNVSNCCRPADNADTGGGGLYNNTGTIIIRNTLFADNKATSPGGYGGAIYNAEIMELDKVALIRNQANYGAGIANGNYNGVTNHLSISNATISSNVGGYTAALDSEGGAIFNLNNGHINIYSSTITRNNADASGGITNRDTNTRVELVNTILADNLDIAGVPDCHGTVISLGYNLMKNPRSSSVYGISCNFVSQATDILYISPLLDNLVINGLAYHPYLANSQGINSGNTSICPPSDIRGVTRPSGPACDIGSYELVEGSTIKVHIPFVIR